MLRFSMEDLAKAPVVEPKEELVVVFADGNKLKLSDTKPPAKTASQKPEKVEPPIEGKTTIPEGKYTLEKPDWKQAEKILSQIEMDEIRIRKERAKLSNLYHQLEEDKAPIEDFTRNYSAIESHTDELKRLWLRKKHVLSHGNDINRPVEKMSAENELILSNLKHQKRRLIDKKSKLNIKIKTAHGTANPAKNEARWTRELHTVEMDIQVLEKRINQLQ